MTRHRFALAGCKIMTNLMHSSASLLFFLNITLKRCKWNFNFWRFSDSKGRLEWIFLPQKMKFSSHFLSGSDRKLFKAPPPRYPSYYNLNSLFFVWSSPNCSIFFCFVLHAYIPTHKRNSNKKSATVMMMNYLYQRNPASWKKKVIFAVYCTFGQACEREDREREWRWWP